MSDYRLEQAYRLVHYGQLTPAITLLKSLLAENPDNAEYHGILADCLAGKARLHAAEHELHIALGLNPALPYLHLVQARIQIMQNKPRQALESIDQALALNPTLVAAYLNKSSILMLQGRRQEALEQIERAAALEPANQEVLVAMGDYYRTTGRLQEALRYATEALASNAQDESANVLMGEVQLAMGNAEDAEYHAKFAIMQNPDSPEALRLFCKIKFHKNPVMGLWWRFNARMATLKNVHATLILIAAFLGFNLLSQIVFDLGYPGAATAIGSLWLILVLYSWIGLPYYYKALKKELDKFSFNPNF